MSLVKEMACNLGGYTVSIYDGDGRIGAIDDGEILEVLKCMDGIDGLDESERHDKITSILDFLLSRPTVMYTAWVDGRLVGILSGYLAESALYIECLVVHEYFRHNSIGTWLVESMLEVYSGYWIISPNPNIRDFVAGVSEEIR